MKIQFTLLSLLGTLAFVNAQQFKEVESEIHNFFYASGDTGFFTHQDTKDILLCGAIDTTESGFADETFCGLYQNQDGKYIYLDNYYFQFPTHLGDAQFFYSQKNEQVDIMHMGQNYNNIIDYKLNYLTAVDNNLSVVHRGNGKIYSQLAIADFNNDGQLDYVTNGSSRIEGHTTSENIDFFEQENGNFTNFLTLEGAQDGGISLTDFNNDQRLDFITLTDAGNLDHYTQAINGQFHKTATYPSLYGSTLAVADFNGDGYMDIAISGSDALDENKLQILWNNGNNTFRTEEIDGSGVTTNSSTRNIAVGDLNNDGYYDIILAGDYDGEESTQILTYNPNSKTFDRLTIPSGLLDVGGPVNLQLIDSGNNHLDVLLTGFAYVNNEYTSVTRLYKNTEKEINQAPTAPTNLHLKKEDNNFHFSWSGATDDKTPVNALRYELTVGSEPGKADLAKYEVTTPSWILVNNHFPETVYWSVKSIDASKVYSTSSSTLSSNDLVSSNSSIEIYPNPASNKVHIKGGKVDSIALYNLAGQQIALALEKDQSINISHLPKGVYILQMIINQKTTTKKLIINH